MRWLWSCTAAIPTLVMHRQEEENFKGIFGYIASLFKLSLGYATLS